MVKNLPANAGDAGDEIFILGSGRSPGVGKGNPLQYCCLENLLSSEPWQSPWGRKDSDWETEHANKHFYINLFETDFLLLFISSVQSLSHVRLCDPMDCSMPGLPVHNILSLTVLLFFIFSSQVSTINTHESCMWEPFNLEKWTFKSSKYLNVFFQSRTESTFNPSLVLLKELLTTFENVEAMT